MAAAGGAGILISPEIVERVNRLHPLTIEEFATGVREASAGGGAIHYIYDNTELVFLLGLFGLSDQFHQIQNREISSILQGGFTGPAMASVASIKWQLTNGYIGKLKSIVAQSVKNTAERNAKERKMAESRASREREVAAAKAATARAIGGVGSAATASAAAAGGGGGGGGTSAEQPFIPKVALEELQSQISQRDEEITRLRELLRESARREIAAYNERNARVVAAAAPAPARGNADNNDPRAPNARRRRNTRRSRK